MQCFLGLISSLCLFFNVHNIMPTFKPQCQMEKALAALACPGLVTFSCDRATHQ